LKHWEFCIKLWLALPFKIRVAKYLLNNAHSMPYNLWQKIRKIQLSKYYFKEIFTFEPNKVRNFIDLTGLSPKY
jgi:hypothetical protein